jgi:hypothetical protein
VQFGIWDASSLTLGVQEWGGTVAWQANPDAVFDASFSHLSVDCLDSEKTSGVLSELRYENSLMIAMALLPIAVLFAYQ